MKFEWDVAKEQRNIEKHGIDFKSAKHTFDDPWRIIISDTKHSRNEARWYCFGMVRNKVLTVWFTIRGDRIRIIGAGFWREGKGLYEKKRS